MGWDAPWHWVVLAIVVIALFGYKRLPDAARSLGRSLRIFKTEMKGMSQDDATRAAATSTPAAPLPTPPAEAPQVSAPAAPAAAAPAETPAATPAAPPAPQPDNSQTGSA